MGRQAPFADYRDWLKSPRCQLRPRSDLRDRARRRFTCTTDVDMAQIITFAAGMSGVTSSATWCRPSASQVGDHRRLRPQACSCTRGVSQTGAAFAADPVSAAEGCPGEKFAGSSAVHILVHQHLRMGCCAKDRLVEAV